MTAIAGLWRLDGTDDAGAGCARMLAALAPYGPGKPAQWDDGAIALGRRLFALLPEDRFDRQPLVAANGGVLVADLRIDNRDEIVGALGLGDAAAMADSAVLLAGIERWGMEVVERLAGPFAFAYWEPAAQRLLLARDPIGMRPLFYHHAPGIFAFATMPKGLHALPEVPHGPDEERVAEFLVNVPDAGPGTCYAGISRIEPGHLATVTPAGVETHSWWTPPRTELRLASPGAYVEALLDHLDTATAACLRGAETHAATQLSAGLDSSAVTTSAARLLAARGGRLTALTAVPGEGFDGAPRPGRLADEGPLAARTAAMYPNIEHVRVRPTRSPLDDLDAIFHLFGGPILNLCNWTWDRAMQEEARARGISVMLTAATGNMSLSYEGIERLPQLLRQGRIGTLVREARGIERSGGARMRTSLARALAAWLPRPVWRALLRLRGIGHDDELRYTAVHPARAAELRLWETAATRGYDPALPPWRDAVDVRLWMLRRGDFGRYFKAVLAISGIDVRDPTADRRLFEFCLAVPLDQYLRDGEPRSLARRALAGRVPPEVLAERRRGTQFSDWYVAVNAARDQIRGEVERLAADRAASTALDIERMRKLLDDWPDEGWERQETVNAYRLALLRGIAAGHFLRRASGSNA